MRRYSNHKRNSLKLNSRKKDDFKTDLKAVSEAIGTILLLAISVSLVGVMAVWVNTLPEPEEAIEADLKGTMVIENDQHIVRIEHMGGDSIEIDQIEISIMIDGITQAKYELFYSTMSIFDDDLWEIGEVWEENIEGFHDWNVSLPEVTVHVRDINADSLILSEVVQMSGELGDLADLKIEEEDIFFDYENATLRNGEWVNISARVYNIGGSLATNAIVRFFEGSRVISNAGKDYRYISSIPVDNYRTVWVNWTPIYFGMRTINVKVYSTQLEANYANNYASKKLEVEPTLPKITGPNLEIEDIVFDPVTPTHGDWVKITVVVKNVGDEEVPAQANINLTLWDENGYLLTKDVQFTFNRTLSNNLTQYETLQPAFEYSSQSTYGGKTKIKALISTDIIESRTDDNYKDKFIQILPTILLVDDDGLFEMYTKDDASSYMDAALQLAVGSGQFDVWTVKGLDGPKFESGDKPLKNYDIVIWMTGYSITNTLTTSDQNAIKQYLENNGKLWLIGMNILEDLRIKDSLPPGQVNSFVTNYLGVTSYDITGTPELLYGVKGENLTEGMALNTSNMIESRDNGINLSLRKSTLNHSVDGILGNDAALGIDGNMSLKYYNVSNNQSFKVVFFGWEFASIIDMVNRNNLTIQILKWFGWELEIGTDLAISSKGFSNQNPNFMDWITITARVRNNGLRGLSRIRVDFFIIDSDGHEERIPEYPGFEEVDNPQFIYIPGDGGERDS